MQTLYAGAWQRAQGPALVARHNLDGARYQADFDALPQQGYRPVCISGGSDDAGFCSLWAQSPGPAWKARHAMSSADYQREFEAAASQGYRLRCISGYVEGGQTRFAALWDQGDGPAWRARHDLAAGAYQEAFDANARDGYRPTWITVYPGGDGARYAALWEQSTGPAWMARHNVGPGDFKVAMDERAAAGWRLVCGTGCAIGDADVYAGIWEAADDESWAAVHGLDAGDYQQAFDQHARAGFRPRFVVSYVGNRRQHRVQPWYVVVQLAGLSGSGSDVDEIYGVLAAAVYDVHGGLGVKPGTADGDVQELLRVNGSVDLSDGETLGRYPGVVFQMPSNARSGYGRLALRSYLYDEDDARDAHPDPDGPDSGNDEHFAFEIPGGKPSYVRNLQLRPPGDDADASDFSREMRVNLQLEAKGNHLTAAIRVRWFRDSSFVPGA